MLSELTLEPLSWWSMCKLIWKCSCRLLESKLCYIWSFAVRLFYFEECTRVNKVKTNKTNKRNSWNLRLIFRDFSKLWHHKKDKQKKQQLCSANFCPASLKLGLPPFANLGSPHSSPSVSNYSPLNTSGKMIISLRAESLYCETSTGYVQLITTALLQLNENK